MATFKSLSIPALALSVAGALLASAASADTLAYTAVDAYLRAGPGRQYQAIDIVRKSDATAVSFCLRRTRWCQVNYNGEEGWVYGDFLAVPIVPAAPAQVYQPGPSALGKSATNDDAIALGSTGVIPGAMPGDSAAFVSPADVNGLMVAATTPMVQTLTYFRIAPVDPVALAGDIEVGSKIPKGIPIYQVPDSRYAYLNADGRYMLVEPVNRRVVQIIGQ